MNKLLLNQSARNHIKIFPMKDTISDLPESEADRIRWCEAEFKRLQRSPDAKRLYIFKKRGNYLISVWEMDDKYYLVQCLRNEFKTYNTIIYISKFKDDMLNIAKFLQVNIDTIMSDYKSQILDARDALLKERYEEITEETVDAEPSKLN